MPTIPIPFTKGQSEAIDAKLLPQGTFSSLINCRYTKEGRLAVRSGYVPLSGALSPAPFAAGNADAAHAVFIADRQSSSVGSLDYDLRADGLFSPKSVISQVERNATSSSGIPRRQGAVRNVDGQVFACDSAVLNGVLYVVSSGTSMDSTVALASSNGAVGVNIYEASTGRLLRGVKLANNGGNVKAIAFSDRVCFVWAVPNANTIQMAAISYTLSTNTLTVITAATTIVTAVAGRAFSFDICPRDSTTFCLCYESSAIVLQWGSVVAATAVYTNRVTQAIANPARPALAQQGDTNIVLLWAEGTAFDTGDLFERRDTITGGAVTAKTMLISGNVAGFPVVGPHGTTTTFHGVVITKSPVAEAFNQVLHVSHGGTINNAAMPVAPASKPFISPAGQCVLWMVDDSTHGRLGASDGAFPTYMLVDLDAVSVQTDGLAVETTAVQGEALSAANYILTTTTPTWAQTNVDPRRSIVTLPTTMTLPGATAIGCVLPVQTTPGRYEADLVRIDTAALLDRGLPVTINGQLVFSGPRVVEFTGSAMFESGFRAFPQANNVVGGGAGGGLSTGVYQYVVVFVFRDEQGRIHRSAPSAPISYSATAGDQAVIRVAPPIATFRTPPIAGPTALTNGMQAEIYRTAVNGSIFHLLTPTRALTFTFFNTLQYNDAATDASIATNPILYTQGQVGGLSGQLENDEPPACRFLVAGSDRLMAGGLEQPEEVWFSKLRIPGEPMQWHNDVLYKLRVGGEVLAGAELDGNFYVWTHDAIYVKPSDGPDDNGGGQPFSEFQRLPTGFGGVSQRSIVQTELGVFFQGSSNRLALLPRGGGAPQWVGQTVRDTLAAFPLISAAVYNKNSALVYWACLNSTATAGRLIVCDMRKPDSLEWFVDNVDNGRAIKTLALWNDRLVIDGQLIETSGTFVDNATTTVVPTWETGDIRLFGQDGWGRYRKVQILAEARDVTASWTMTLAVSYDSGKTYGETASWTRAGLPITTIGDAIDGAEHMFVTQRTDSVRLRGTWTTATPTEGVVWHGLSLEGEAAQGSKRQANSMRAP